jgi:hypothetical protein
MKRCIGTELPNGVTTYPHLVEDQALAKQNSGHPLTRAREPCRGCVAKLNDKGHPRVLVKKRFT